MTKFKMTDPEFAVQVVGACIALGLGVVGVVQFQTTNDIRRTEMTLNYYNEYLSGFKTGADMLTGRIQAEKTARTRIVQARCAVYQEFLRGQPDDARQLPDCDRLAGDDAHRLEPFLDLHEDPKVPEAIRGQTIKIMGNLDVDIEQMVRVIGFYNAVHVCTSLGTCDETTAAALFGSDVLRFLDWSCGQPPDRFNPATRSRIAELADDVYNPSGAGTLCEEASNPDGPHDPGQQARLDPDPVSR